jgi:hypothetical protein
MNATTVLSGNRTGQEAFDPSNAPARDYSAPASEFTTFQSIPACTARRRVSG